MSVIRTRLIPLVAALTLLLASVATPASAAVKVVKFPCKFSHRAQVDPIVSPGVASGHLHDFFGNTSTNKDSTYASMTAASGTCNFAGDTAGYWVPTLYDASGTPLAPKATVYYGNEPHGHAVPFPPDFRMVAGAPHAFSSNPNSFWGWSCDNSDPLSSTVTTLDCSGNTGGNALVAIRIFFPNCGQLDAAGNIITDSPDHRAHVTYPVGGKSTRSGTCPADHPVELPRIRVIINYDTSVCHDCYLSSDKGVLGGSTAHADFWNTWQQDALVSMVGQLNA